MSDKDDDELRELARLIRDQRNRSWNAALQALDTIKVTRIGISAVANELASMGNSGASVSLYSFVRLLVELEQSAFPEITNIMNEVLSRFDAEQASIVEEPVAPMRTLH